MAKQERAQGPAAERASGTGGAGTAPGGSSGEGSAVWPVAGAAACWLLSMAVLYGTALVAGDQVVEIQLGDSTSAPLFPVLGGLTAGLVLALGCLLLAVRGARLDPRHGRRTLIATAVGLGGIAVVLTAVTAAQWSMSMTIADTAMVDGATVPGQGMISLAVVLLAVGCVAASVLALRRRLGSDATASTGSRGRPAPGATRPEPPSGA